MHFLRGKGRSHWIVALLMGAASGLVMALATAVGINWAQAVFPGSALARVGEAVAFVIATVGAYLGVSRLSPEPVAASNGS